MALLKRDLSKSISEILADAKLKEEQDEERRVKQKKKKIPAKIVTRRNMVTKGAEDSITGTIVSEGTVPPKQSKVSAKVSKISKASKSPRVSKVSKVSTHKVESGVTQKLSEQAKFIAMKDLTKRELIALEMEDPFFLNYAPFGIRTKRFYGLGFHPDLDKHGTMKRDVKLGPGQYNPQYFQCRYKKYQIGGSPWTRKKNMEEFSRELGFKFPHMLEERRTTKMQGGPGTNDFNYDLFKRKTASNKQNADFGLQKKFYSIFKNINPPPDSYFRDIMKYSTVIRKQKTPVPMFEWDGFTSRFKSFGYPWSQAPNRYSPQDPGSIEALLAKRVSKRGPYDLFTGPRDETTIKNHFAASTFKGSENCFFTWPNEIDILLHHPKKRRCGKFLKAERFPKYPTVRMMLNDLSLCYRDPDAPSPASYKVNVDTIKILPETKYPFNNSVLEARKGVEWSIQPGPGRYQIKYPKCKEKKRASWVFKSKVQRNIVKVIDYKAF